MLGRPDAGRTAQVVMTREGSLHGPGDQLDGLFEARIEVPPIRHRGDDIDQLVRHFLRRYCPGGGITCSAAALAALQQCPWPGNIRQIDAVVRDLVRRQPGRVIQKEDLPPECRVSSRAVLTPMEALERDAILRGLEDLDANVQRTAQSLGISRATMYRKMRRYGIAPSTLS
ncbi:MAG: helix-turn-helix domain-containing protein [Mycobacteriales bacterium]